MKTIRLFAVIAICSGLLTACSKQESPAPAPAAAETKPAAEAPKPAAVASQATAEVQKQAETTQSTVQEATNTAAVAASSLIDKAKALVADSKYSEAMDLLNKVSAMKLTPEQQQMVNDLMAQVKQAMSGAAASDAAAKAKNAVGGMMGGSQ